MKPKIVRISFRFRGIGWLSIVYILLRSIRKPSVVIIIPKYLTSYIINLYLLISIKSFTFRN